MGFDEKTGLAYRGILGSIKLIAPKDSRYTGNVNKGLKKSHPIKDVLTYPNTGLSIAYSALGGAFEYVSI